jgi:hypothetical protein
MSARLIERLVMAALAFALIISMRTCGNKVDALQEANARLTDSLTIHKNREGELIATVRNQQATLSDLGARVEALGTEMQQMVKEIGGLKKVNAILVAKAEVKETIYVTTTDTVYTDSTGQDISVRRFSYNNGYMAIDGEAYPMSTKLSYKYNIEFNSVTYRKRTGAFRWIGLGPVEYLTDLKFKDPRVTPTSMQSITVTHKPKLLEQPWLWGLIGTGLGFWIRGQ